MAGRVVLIATAVLVVVAIGLSAARTQLPERPLVLAGWVRVSTSEDGLTTVVTLTHQEPTIEAADVVEWAFRLQHISPQHLAFEGPATISHTLNRLVVSTSDREGWAFAVAGRPTVKAYEPVPYPELAVLGLSRHWGDSIHRSHEAVVMALFAGVCNLGEGEGICDTCAAGGKGETSCEVNCGDDGCSAECAEGHFACCNCPRSCGCCPNRINGSAAATAR